MNLQNYKYDSQFLLTQAQSHVQKQHGEQQTQEKSSVGSELIDISEKALQQNDLKTQSFRINCNNCGKEGEQTVCEMSIPYFKNMLVFSFICSECGSHQTETKNGGPIGQFGKKIILEVSDPADLKRDIYKSDSASLIIPEISFEMGCGSSGGQYTTIEGLIENILEDLEGNDTFIGDQDNFFDSKIQNFLNTLEDCQLGNRKFTLIIDDPLNKSFIQNLNYPLADYKIKVSMYKRTYEQNDEFGLNDIKTENYEND